MENNELLSAIEELELTKAVFEAKELNKKIDELNINKEELTSNELAILNNSTKAINKLVESNQRLVSSIVSNYLGNGLSYEDLFQEGNLGLVKAIEKFDYRLGNRLSTYATYWIRESIGRALTNNAKSIRIPAYVKDDINKVKNTERELTQTLNRKVTSFDIANKLNLDIDYVEYLFTLTKDTISLDAKIKNDEETCVSDYVADTSSQDPLKYCEISKRDRMLNKALDEVLNDRERYIISNKYGLNKENKTMTLVEMSKVLNISKERVRQLEENARLKLRREASELRDFIA